MTFLQSLILGLTQAVTEFLPISSDGHLNLVQKILGLTPSLSLDIFLHAATFLSVLWFFKKDTKYFFNHLKYIVIGSVPAMIVGFFLKDLVESTFSNASLLPVFFLITTLFLFATRFFKTKEKPINYKTAFIIGLFQALAILPGVSRSASTMFAGLLLGLSPISAFNFSFSLFIPASLGAIALGVTDLDVLSLVNPQNILTFAVTAVVGVLSLTMLKKFMVGNKLWYFSLYTLCVAILSLIIF